MGRRNGVGERACGAKAATVTPHGLKVRRGQERAHARGVRVGRPRNPALTPAVLERARAMRAAGMRVREIASALGVPKTTLHRGLHEQQGLR
jgi:DNA invertase Pin-like site-specific DNA recombinase